MTGSTAIPANLGPQAIEHLVVLMLENRSFDLVLGTLYPASPSFDGLTDVMGNADSAGDPLLVGPAPGTITDPDPHHDLASVVEQLTGPNQGFIVNYEGRLGPGQWPLRRQVLDYATETTMPVLWRLAREYAVSDRWFCSVPAETWPNRLFVHCGTSLGKVSDRPWRWLPPSLYPATSIFARLGPELSAWACYNDQLPNMLLVEELADEYLRSRDAPDSHFRSIAQFEGDCANAKLPRYSFIEPNYLFAEANDDHPPHDLRAGEQLISRIYTALRRSPLWSKSALLILYDEHGGFFDHVPPPHDVLALAIDPGLASEHGFAFTRLGPRVPCLLISAWTEKGSVFRPPDGAFFDHTSVIASLQARWPELGPPLTARVAAAATIWPALTRSSAREDDGELPEEISAILARRAPAGGAPTPTAPRARGGGRGALAYALKARLVGVPLVRCRPGFIRRTGMHRSMSILGLLVGLRSLRRPHSTFTPPDVRR
jgi:phospholipase C